MRTLTVLFLFIIAACSGAVPPEKFPDLLPSKPPPGFKLPEPRPLLSGNPDGKFSDRLPDPTPGPTPKKTAPDVTEIKPIFEAPKPVQQNDRVNRDPRIVSIEVNAKQSTVQIWVNDLLEVEVRNLKQGQGRSVIDTTGTQITIALKKMKVDTVVATTDNVVLIEASDEGILVTVPPGIRLMQSHQKSK